MLAPRSRRNPWFAILFILAVVAIRGYKLFYSPPVRDSHREHSAPAGNSTSPENDGRSEKSGGFEVYRNCTLVTAPHNDGDSFMVKLPTGRQAEFRLNFVDTPESAFKTYGGGESNHQRIHQQATDLGITDEQAVEIGQQAKHFTLDLLASRPFTLYTTWDSPYHDDRFHAHVEVSQDGKPRWLHQLLVERGLVRLITKPANLPDGTSAAKELQNLRNLEREAKRNRVGVWSRGP